jgi:5-methylcytosine-specific restriction endonuclease McrA
MPTGASAALLMDGWLETGVCGRTSYQGHSVQEYLSEQLGGRCAICGIDGKWNGVALALALAVDHVNGDATHDRRENLWLICPNCDSQLPTFKARNRGMRRHYRRQRYANEQSY